MENIMEKEKIVARPGFEPRHSDPESDVLPLYYQARSCKSNYYMVLIKNYSKKNPRHPVAWNAFRNVLQSPHIPMNRPGSAGTDIF